MGASTSLAATIAAATLLAGATGAQAAPVTIVRDSHGEPHVRASSAADASYGFAWAQMEDQATYLLGDIAAATGRSAELLGPACLPSCFRRDQTTRLFRVPETAYSLYGSVAADTRTRLRAFADGINAYIDAHPSRVPSWAEHVTPQDVLAGVEARFVLAQVGGGGGGGPSGTPPASNAFVLDGSKTANGSPLLAGNPHLPWDGDTRWYAAQLVYPGARIQGVTFRGSPGIAMGSNGDVAWTNTANGTHNESDRYLETLHPSQPDQYLYGGSYQQMQVRTVSIGVQRTPGVVTQVPVRMRYTLHGPVISDPPAQASGVQPAPATDVATSATISQYQQVGLATQLFAMDEASSLAEFRAALSQNQLSGFNVIAADHSDVFYAGASRSGIRNPGLPLNGSLDGSNPYTAWQGILPFEQIPQATDPPSGYYQNANNAPWFSAPGQIVQADLPYYLRGGGNGPRSRRQVALLDPAAGVDIAAAEQIGNDTFIEFSPSLVSLLDQAAAAPGADARVVAAATIIDAWDGRASIEATGFPLFATWVRGLDGSALGFSVEDPPPPSTSFSAAQTAEAARAMIVAYDGMVGQYGTAAVRHGDLKTIDWGSLSEPVAGGEPEVPTLRMAHCKGEPGASSPVFYHPCSAKGGSSSIFNVDMGTGRFTISRPASDSDDPGSPHYTDNAADFAAGRFREFPVSDAAVDAEQTSRLELTAPGRPSLTVTPASLGFGSRRVASGGSAPAQVVVGNPGPADVFIYSAAVGGAGSSSFSIGAGGCAASSLGAGESCALELRFEPRAAGPLAAELELSSDAAAGLSRVALSGTGLAAKRLLSVEPKSVRAGRRGRLALPLRCRADAGERCKGTLRLRVRRRRLGLGGGGLRTVASRGLKQKPGRAKLRLRLSRRARKALDRLGRLEATVVIDLRASGGEPSRYSEKLRVLRGR